MGRRVRILILLISVASRAAAFFSSYDLFDPVYGDLSSWELAGLIPRLPRLRPYPPQFIDRMLQIVVESGGKDAERARHYLVGTGQLVRTRFVAETQIRVDSGGLFFGNLSPSVATRLDTPGVDADGRYTMNLLDSTDGLILPAYDRAERDWVPDWAEFDLFDRSISIRQNLASNLSVGDAVRWFQFGIGRSSIGPFYHDGLALSRSAPSSIHLSFTWHTAQLSGQFLQAELTATDDAGGGRYPDKRLVLHSITWRPLSWFALDFYDSVVYGNRFDLRYLIPISSLYLTQGIAGFVDNALIGLGFEFRPFQWLSIPVSVYADDVHFNDLIRLDFETKYKLSFQVGASANPPWLHEIDRVSIDYLAVMPYMYSHRDQDDTTVPNFSNYTQSGASLGPSLEPNSDRLSFRISGRPIKPIRLVAYFEAIRHGNPSTGFTSGDGTVFDDGYDDEGQPTFQSETRFLIQDLIEQTAKAGLTSTLSVRVRGFEISAVAGYTFTYSRNVGLIEGETESVHTFELSVGTRF